MKKTLLAIAVAATVLTSCGTDSKDSYSTMNFAEYNLITDLEDQSAPAQATPVVYNMMLNYSKNCVDIKAYDLAINDQKISFETDTMALTTSYLVSQDGENYITQGHFSKKTNVGKGAEITNINATFTPGVYNITSISIPGYESTQYAFGYRLLMGYDLNNKYHVRTFWPLCYYAGKSYVSGSGTSHSTNNTSYRVELNFEKKTARVAVLYPEFSTDDKDVPQAIVFEEVPIKFDHNSYYLKADSPKTRVLGKKDNTTALVESEQYKASNFSMTIVSQDLTEVAINYSIDNKQVNFDGCSIVKATNSSN